MALATQCPHCGTAFRVAHDQLKLRGGLVRCGACKEIFNGIEHLLHVDPAAGQADTVATDGTATENPAAEQAQSPDDAAAGMAQPATAAQTGEPVSATVDSDLDTTADDDSDTPSAAFAAPVPDAADPLQRMTLMDFAAGRPSGPDHDIDQAHATEAGADAEPSDTAEADELERAIDDLERNPLRHGRQPEAAMADAAEESAEADEPDFMQRARRQQAGRGMRRVLLASACLLLLLGAVAQATYAFRSQIAAHFPAVKPLLAAACAELGCRIALPMQIDSVTIESSELQMLAPDPGTFSLGVLLRNRSATVEAWPQIELTLNDAAEQPLLRRVFLPREYLPAGQSEERGFAANSEQALRIYFETTIPKAAGYRIYVFYS